MSFLFVNIGFIFLIGVMLYFKSAQEIKENWPKYRCNPPYWVFSDDIRQDFTYCVQNTQMNVMGYMLQPFNSLLSGLTTVGGEFSENLNGIRTMISTIRDFVSSIVENIFGVFLNLVIEFQRMILSMKDMLGKTIGIVVTMLYILDGSIKTMNSAWKGPPGQMVQAIGSCFHPDTQLRLTDGSTIAMKNVPLGATLMLDRDDDNGDDCEICRVFSVMKIDNRVRQIPFYRLCGRGVNGADILVTGEHYIWDDGLREYIKVKNYARDHPEICIHDCDENIVDEFACLITTNGKIPMGRCMFLDWEDTFMSNDGLTN